MDIEKGQIIAERYRLVRKLSQGGMGSVWVADHLQLNTKVAIKFVRDHIVNDEQAMRRFEREAKASAQIKSPHVVHIYDHGVDGDLPFLVMELLEGQDLHHRLKSGDALSPYEAVQICEQVCKGLEKAHQLGIVHRDLKPGNIFLREDDGVVKILDFGIAKEMGFKKMVESEQTETGQILGSPSYMSPEQATSEPLDGRSDLWSLAVILFRVLTGERAFPQQDLGNLFIQICTGKPRRVSMFRTDLAPMDRFFDQAFQRDVDKRFQDARSFARAFKGRLAHTLGLVLPDESAAWAAASPDSMSFEPDHGDEPTRKSDMEEATLFDTSHTLRGVVPRTRGKLVAAGLALGALGLVAVWVLGGRDPATSTPAAPPPVPAASSSEPSASALPTAGPRGESTAAPSAVTSARPKTRAAAKRRPTPPPRPAAQPRPKPKPTDLDITDY